MTLSFVSLLDEANNLQKLHLERCRAEELVTEVQRLNDAIAVMTDRREFDSEPSDFLRVLHEDLGDGHS